MLFVLIWYTILFILVISFDLPNECESLLYGGHMSPPLPHPHPRPPPPSNIIIDTLAPSLPTNIPSLSPTMNTNIPTLSPSNTPSDSPTESPSMNPSISPSNSPSMSPSLSPTLPPSIKPSLSPSIPPSNTPSISPTHGTQIPSKMTMNPTIQTLSPTYSAEAMCCFAINNWKNNSNGCETSLRGIGNPLTCKLDANNTYIERINLKACGLAGWPPQEFEAFKHLKSIDLSDNKLSSLTKIWNNQHSWENLEELILNNNTLSGDVPNNIFQYKSLTKIDISQNKHFRLNIGTLNLTKTQENQNKIYHFNASYIEYVVNGIHDTKFYDLFNNLNYANLSLRGNNIKFQFNTTLCDINISYIFDLRDNEINGTFPLNFRGHDAHNKSSVKFLFLSGNYFNSTDITNLTDHHLSELALVQREDVYQHQRGLSSCYMMYDDIAVVTDWDNYCINKNRFSHVQCQGCETFTDTNNALTFRDWVSKNRVYVMLIGVSIALIILFCILKNTFKKNTKPKWKPLKSNTKRGGLITKNELYTPRCGPGHYTRKISDQSSIMGDL